MEERIKRSAEALQADLDATEKKVGELEKEIGPLRRLAEVAGKFLDAVMDNWPKLGPDLIAMLKEIGELIGNKDGQELVQKLEKGDAAQLFQTGFLVLEAFFLRAAARDLKMCCGSTSSSATLTCHTSPSRKNHGGYY
ncbi:hypothetical protein TSACC_2578 [Terrimicrobium sacchariphilum]|uniref:Uncharacterized protein n=1 Tax=Terrimicrobium sacchariphilum TaxID=690879 RepID=A0A146G3E8_TERSA|nr:hypothetical protein [Terrimicrobium sacchariphilum]GAT32180.1 hypothetical protein TSACC_2578 [Terrimicrobium sacchariphilum]